MARPSTTSSAGTDFAPSEIDANGLCLHIDRHQKRHPLLHSWDNSAGDNVQKRRIELLHKMDQVGSKYYIENSEDMANVAMFLLSRFMSLYRIFGLEISLHRRVHAPFANALFKATEQLFHRSVFAERLMREFIVTCNIRVLTRMLEVAALSEGVTAVIEVLCAQFYPDVIDTLDTFRVVSANIKGMKQEAGGSAAYRMLNALYNSGRPFPSREMCLLATNMLEHFLEVSTVLPVRLACADWIAKHVFPALAQDSSVSQDANDGAGRCITQDAATTLVIFHTIRILTENRKNVTAIQAAFRCLRSFMQYGNRQLIEERGKEMLPNLVSLMRNHPSDDPDRHWKDIHPLPQTSQEAAIIVLGDLLKHGGHTLGDTQRVIFALVSSLTHVDEYTVQVEAVKILQRIISRPHEWQVGAMTIRLIVPPPLMKSFEKLSRFMQREEDSVSEKAAAESTKHKQAGKLWSKMSQLATTSVEAADGSRIISTRAAIRTFLTQELTLENIHKIRRALTDYGWKAEHLRPLTPPQTGKGWMKTKRMMQGILGVNISRRKGHHGPHDKAVVPSVSTTQNTILLRLKQFQANAEKENKHEQHRKELARLKLDPTLNSPPSSPPNTPPHEKKRANSPVSRHFFIPISIPAVIDHVDSHETGLHDVSFIRRANMSIDIQQRSAQASSGLSNALGWTNSVASSIARDVLRNEDANVENKKAADTLVAAKFGTSHASVLRPSEGQLLQDRVDRGMVLLMMQRNQAKQQRAGRGRGKPFTTAGMPGTVRMKSENMLKVNQGPSKPSLISKAHAPSPRSKALLTGYCRGTRIENVFEEKKAEKTLKEKSFLGTENSVDSGSSTQSSLSRPSTTAQSITPAPSTPGTSVSGLQSR